MEFVFDECIGRPVMAALGELLKFSPSPPALRHVLDFQCQGLLDEQWIPKAAELGDVLITADGGRGGRTKSKGRKLTQVCFACKMSYVVLSGQLHDEPNGRKAAIVAGVWDDIAKTPAYPRGSRFSLRRRTQGGPPVLLYVPTDDTGFPLPPSARKEFLKDYQGPLKLA